MTLPLRGYAEGSQGQVHYCDTGGDGTALVLLHQAPLSLRQFESVYPLFAAAGLRAVGIDLPGFGGSDCASAPPTVEEYAEVVPTVLDHLGIAAAHLCGHHTGAMVCVAASLASPDRVLSLSLSGPAPLTPEEQRHFLDSIVADERAYEPREDGSHIMEMWERRMAFLPAERKDRAALCTGYLLQPLSAPAPFWYGHNAAFSYDMTAAIERVTHRTMVLANTSDMIFELGARTMAMRPDFHYREVEGGGVDPTDLVTEEWTDAVLRFLESG